jgi:hypothetical protein
MTAPPQFGVINSHLPNYGQNGIDMARRVRTMGRIKADNPFRKFQADYVHL